MLQDLRDQGWASGRQPGEHTSDSPRQFTGPAPQFKPYLRCLLVLPALLSETFPSLPSRQPMGYDSCVLSAAHPEQVPRQATGEVYKKRF